MAVSYSSGSSPGCQAWSCRVEKINMVMSYLSLLAQTNDLDDMKTWIHCKGKSHPHLKYIFSNGYLEDTVYVARESKSHDFGFVYLATLKILMHLNLNNFKNTFHIVQRDSLRKILSTCGFARKLIRLIRWFYWVWMCLPWQQQHYHRVTFWGVGKRCTLAPILILIAMDRIMRNTVKRKIMEHPGT